MENFRIRQSIKFKRRIYVEYIYIYIKRIIAQRISILYGK